MATTISQLLSKIGRFMTVALFTSWSLTALSIVALTSLNANRTLVSIVASSSLLTFLVCKLLCAFDPPPGHRYAPNATVAHLLATADYGSRQGAAILLVLCCTWLYLLSGMGLLLGLMTMFGGILVAAIHNADESAEMGRTGTGESSFGHGSQHGQSPEGMADLNSTDLEIFREAAGFDPTEIIRAVPPKALIYFVVVVWVNFLSLGLFVLQHAFDSLRRVLSSPTSGVVTRVNPVPVGVPATEERAAATQPIAAQDIITEKASVPGSLVVEGWEKMSRGDASQDESGMEKAKTA